MMWRTPQRFDRRRQGDPPLASIFGGICQGAAALKGAKSREKS